MTQHLVFLLLGLGNGAVFGALAIAVVMTYRSSGVLNFATGAIALYTAYAYAYLRQGELLILVPGLPVTVEVSDPMGLWPALLIALVMAAILGLLLYLLVFRPLRTAPPVAKAVAALGVSLLISGLAAQMIGTTPITVDPIFPSEVWSAGDLRVSSDRIYLAVTVVVVAVVLALIFRFTKFGLATRAAAESERGAYVSGISPDRVAVYNWMISSAVAGLAGILIAPIVPLVPVAYTLFIVPALAAAIAARFQWVVMAAVAGLVIGMLQSEAQYLATKLDWLPSAGLSELVPLIIILILLVVRAQPLPSRGAVIERNLGRAPRPEHVVWTTIAFGAIALVGLIVLEDRFRTGLIVSLIMAIIALSTVVVTGYAGQVSLAQLTIAGVAGFVVGPLTSNLHIPFPIAPLLAALIATVLGVIIGLPALRIRGLTVAVVTLAMAFAVEAVWFRNSDFVGSAGQAVPAPTLFGWDLGIGAGLEYPRLRFGVLCLIVLIVVGVAVALLRRSRLGAQMLAVRANERSAAAAGVNVTVVKIAAFAIAAFIAGLGGSLLAYQQQTVTFDSFSALNGLILFGAVYLAGATSVSGGNIAGLTAAGGLLIIVIDEAFTVSGWYPVVASLLLVLTVIFNPEGVVGPVHALIARWRHRSKAPTDAATGAAAAIEVAARKRPVLDPDAPPILELRNLSVHYGGVVAVDDVSFSLAKGTVVGLIGPNGAGKTTLIDAISGFAPHRGDVMLGGRSIDKMVPHRRIRSGLGRTFQAIELYDDLSVTENIKVGLTAASSADGHVSDMNHAQRVDAIFSLLGLDPVRDRPASELSQGQRQLVSIARALVGSPTALLLDEPAGGLDTSESRWLAKQLRAVRDSGISILLVDHDMGFVLGLCDRIHVLNFGKVIMSGTPEEIRNDRTVAEAYLGNAHAKEITS
ncbi:branched-chain amino acid ABC transporter permease/ATP-binding protein [Rhodococcoides yunnanense]|uniref:Branched-chain amino acid ABC transporter permease/ATP-binding protein n=1 Tax=Rhodococcoides yunnanense TaxID=278209 RepID=A0ABU4BKZ1_9NOCA|nr:branched-chain amino acid ABC transporter permease/ATP-binding protein [Rhodococcus yunnanensis]MDV6264743.1 branched-chain amino acid ABC transporter permease/ATP-binding protein [Rhodococcus yunnanensis]